MNRFASAFALVGILIFCAGMNDCDSSSQEPPVADSGIKKVHAEVATDAHGQTTEQGNVWRRLKDDNKPGAIKHLYVISAYSGQVLIYSTVAGKVTSSGKRLSPSLRAIAMSGGQSNYDKEYNPELLGDDGTYGNSVDYIYWWDTRGIYHQHYVSGGQILHISSEPLAVKGVVINMALEQK